MSNSIPENFQKGNRFGKIIFQTDFPLLDADFHGFAGWGVGEWPCTLTPGFCADEIGGFRAGFGQSLVRHGHPVAVSYFALAVLCQRVFPVTRGCGVGFFVGGELPRIPADKHGRFLDLGPGLDGWELDGFGCVNIGGFGFGFVLVVELVR